jgi:hypothetical protein
MVADYAAIFEKFPLNVAVQLTTEPARVTIP